MTLNDHQLRTALDGALHHIRTTLTAVAARVSEALGSTAQSGGATVARELASSTQFDLRRNIGTLHQMFADELSRRTAQELATPREPARRVPTATSWQTLSLVDDTEMEERMLSDRIGQQISHACESELRELAGYMGALLLSGHADPDRNPLRAEVIGASMYRAIEAVTVSPESRTLLARELGAAMAKSMPECYARILQMLQDRGLQPIELKVRQVEGPGNQLPGLNSGYATLSSTRSQHGEFEGSLPSQMASDASGYQRDGRSVSTGTHSLSGPSTGGSRTGRAGPISRSGLSAAQADAQLMALLRHLTAVASVPGALDAMAPRNSRPISLSSQPIGPAGFGGAAAASPGAAAPPYAGNGLTGLMAVNLIRAHREELMQASSGKLDHMVIDVVGSLFDQILSDSRVPPQMARQIARLQLPVLRVALNDSSFFSSRRHPVRRFVNRIASLACAFDDFDDGPGKHFLKRVSELVQEIVEGDFDQIELYDAKLAALEGFIAEQTHDDAQQQGAISTLGSKETELRLQQRYMLQLRAALTPLQLAQWLRDFLSQVWSQALVLAVSRDGPAADRAVRYRRVGRDLVMSVQPKGSPPLRKKFLMLLPPLMKDLNEGLALVGWPEPAQREFFGRLLPAHAESLKLAPQSELDHNMMVKQLEGIFAMPVPGNESISPADPALEVDADVIATRFSPEEAKSVGFVSESAVDWSGVVDIDLNDEAAEGPVSESGADSTDAMIPGIDIDINLSSAEPAEPTRGPQLMDHIKLGFAYQMHLKDEWQKVRLAHVSAARSFFVFTRGKKHQETISMTARMLVRMCETSRFRAVESAYLMERATLRARKQLAALGTATRH
ncbi:MAG: DUF1631 family protein [Pseudomonadota bacterium]